MTREELAEILDEAWAGLAEGAREDFEQTALLVADRMLEAQANGDEDAIPIYVNTLRSLKDRVRIRFTAQGWQLAERVFIALSRTLIRSNP